MSDIFLSFKKMMTEFANTCPYEIGGGFATIDENNPSVRWPGTTWQRLDGVYPYSKLFKTSVDDLSNITWTFKHHLDYRTFPQSQSLITYNLNFTSNGLNFKGIRLRGYGNPSTVSYLYEMLYLLSDGTGVKYVYEFSSDSMGTDDWLSNNYKTISITGGSDTKNQTMLNFFLTNRVYPENFGYDYELGEIVEPGLPNITGVGHYADNNNEFSGAFYNVKNANYIGDGSASGTLIGLDASRSNSIYGNSDTVRPRSFVANYWLRIG